MTMVNPNPNPYPFNVLLLGQHSPTRINIHSILGGSYYMYYHYKLKDALL